MKRERGGKSKSWQECWITEMTDRWIAKLISSVTVCMKRKHVGVNYYRSNLLTGHGCLNAYLLKIWKRGSHYSDSLKDDAKYTFFECK